MTAAAETSDQLTNLDPVVYKFNIVEINQVLGQLFIRTSQSPFGQIVNEDYKIFWVLKTYEKIKRPREWYDFVLDNRRDYKRRLVTDATDLMADATSKYNELAQFTGEYAAATTTVEQSVVAMMTTLKKLASAKREASAKKETSEGEAKRDAKKRKVDQDADPKPPPFLTHTKESAKNGGTDYKEGDSKVWNGTKMYYHVSPNHKDNKRWFQHVCSACITCNKWKDKQKKDTQDGGGNGDAPPLSAALSDTSSEGDASTLTGTSSVETLLLQAFDQVEGTANGDAVQAFIADALDGLRT